MQRLTRIAGSFAIIMIVYWTYVLLAVPCIEPSVDPNHAQAITNAQHTAGKALVEQQLKQLQGLFRPGAWELKNPIILESESNHAKLLLKDYHNLRDGRVDISCCTIVFGSADEARRRESIILEVPHGAVLKFDQPLDLNRPTKLGHLVDGQLRGPVTMRSAGKEPGPEDDLLVTTPGDIQLTEQTISTPSTVDFRWGPHVGRGQDMFIKLLAGPQKAGAEVSGPNISGIESFELRHVEKLHLELGEKTAAASGTPASVPVEISCRGPLHFDAVGHVVTFRDRVEVMKANPFGPSDQLLCELLSLFLMERPKEKSAPAAKTDPKVPASFDLAVERVEARGTPAVLTAPSRKVVARGERLEYNVPAKSLALDGGQAVFLQQGPNEIHARSLNYQSAEPGHLGRVEAQGPGFLHGQSLEQPDQQLEASWKGKLLVFPYERNQVIALSDGAELKFPGVGQLQAQEIFFWLTEMPPTAKNPSPPPRPDRMCARHNVHINSAQLTGKVDDLQVWFDVEEGFGSGGLAAGGLPNAARADHAASGRPNEGLPATQPIVLAAQPPVGATVPAPQQPLAAQRFEVDGRLLLARVLLGQQKTTVSKLTIEDDVQFFETQVSQPGERPVVIRGDKLEGTGMTGPNAVVTVTGRPARFEGRGVGMSGGTIELDRGTNHLRIDGPGQMEKADAALPGQTSGPPGVLKVDWQRSMVFDSRKIRFDQGVVATMGQWQIRTERMEVQLVRPISFSEPNGVDPHQAEANVETIQCFDGVWMENREFDPQRQLSSHDQLKVSDMILNAINGEFESGPGWLNNVQRGTDNPLSGPTAALAGGRPSGAAPAPRDQLNCLHVQFQKKIAGNFWRHQLTFSDRVQMAYASVDNWDAVLAANNLDRPGPGGVTVRCNELSVAQMLFPIGDQRSVALVAQGNTVVESTTYTALADRITYDGAKDLLVLSGDGRTKAELYRQLQPGAERDHQAADNLYYHPKTNQMGSAAGVRSLEFLLPSGGNGKR